MCLLGTNKEDDSTYQVVAVNVSSVEESAITEIPYEADCALVCVTGLFDNDCSLLPN